MRKRLLDPTANLVGAALAFGVLYFGHAIGNDLVRFIVALAGWVLWLFACALLDMLLGSPGVPTGPVDIKAGAGRSRRTGYSMSGTTAAAVLIATAAFFLTALMLWSGPQLTAGETMICLAVAALTFALTGWSLRHLLD